MTTLALVSGFALCLLGIAASCVRRAGARARRHVRACEERERALYDAAGALFEASRRSSASVLETLDRSVRSLDAAVDTVAIFAPTGDELACVHASGPRAEHFRRTSLRRDDPRRLPARAAQAGCRVGIAEGDPLFPNDRAAVAVPMLDGKSVRAVAYASSTDARALGSPDMLVRAIEFASAPYAVALEREADRIDATYDGLTGALAPRAFRRLLHEDVARAKVRGGDVLSLWFVDTDGFKRVNDEFGHRAGDAVLIAMANLLQAHAVPDLDVAARNGGDEFCALIRGSSKSGAIERAQAFCDAVRAYDFGLPLRVTASVGVATFPYDATASNELLESADAAMYHGKRAGGDRVAFVAERGRYALFER